MKHRNVFGILPAMIFISLLGGPLFAQDNPTRDPGPDLYQPADGNPYVGLPVNFQWEDMSYVQYYQLQVDETSGFGSPLLNVQPEPPNYTFGGLQLGTTYYWRVRAYQGPIIYEWTDWSQIYSFTTVCPLPGSFALVSPADGAVDLVPPVTFDWNSSTNATDYEISIDNQADFMTPEVEETVVNSYYSGADLPGGVIYYWRVRAHNSCGYSSWSEGRSFRLDLCGDVNNDQAVNILDIVYMIDYKFKGGAAPVCR